MKARAAFLMLAIVGCVSAAEEKVYVVDFDPPLNVADDVLKRTAQSISGCEFVARPACDEIPPVSVAGPISKVLLLSLLRSVGIREDGFNVVTDGKVARVSWSNARRLCHGKKTCLDGAYYVEIWQLGGSTWNRTLTRVIPN